MGILLSRIVDVRQLRLKQFQPLLQAECRAWLEDLHWDYTASSGLVASYLEEKRLSGFALVENDVAQAYCLYFREGSKGLIGTLFALPGNSSSAAENLLGKTIDALLGFADARRIEAQLPHFSFDQIGPYFRSRGFHTYLRQFMAFRLGITAGRGQSSDSQGGLRRENAAPGDFIFQPWERKHDREAAQLIHRVYQNHIDAAVNDQYRSIAGTTHLVESIVRNRGCGDYLPQASIAAIHRSTGKVAGILGLTTVRPGTAHIPQIAVATPYQGIGLGSAMLRIAFERLARAGFLEVSLTVTALNSGAVRIYERTGFRMFREFGAFVWNRS
ncbi:MAG TPA: GNAT family N-acetyltransferase [Terriglobia bacterium]|nr:GNAT family N-acetyltransferase [Terriglobia bacterium]